MVVDVPFRHWASLQNPWPESPRRTLYYLETAEGQHIIAAIAIRTCGDQFVYQSYDGFVQESQNTLPLGHVFVWNYSFQLHALLDDSVCHSFV